MTIPEKLAKKIEEELGITCLPETFERTYAGKWMKTQGAYVWEMSCSNGRTIGSMYPASQLVKNNIKLELSPYDNEIFPKD